MQFILCFKGRQKGHKQALILTIVHDCDGNAFARVAQLPGFCHIKIQPRGPIRLACVYLIVQMIVTRMTCGTQVRKSVNKEKAFACFYIRGLRNQF